MLRTEQRDRIQPSNQHNLLSQGAHEFPEDYFIYWLFRHRGLDWHVAS